MSDLTKDLNETERLPTQTAVESLEDVYEPVNQLHVPREAIEMFDEQGFELRWVRIYEPRSQSVLDLKNIQKREQEGYVFVKRSDIPGLTDTLEGVFGKSLSQGDHGLYVIGENALAKLSHGKVAARQRYNEDRTRSRSRAIIEDLKKNNVMPNAIPDGEFRTVYNAPVKMSRNVNFGKTSKKTASVGSDEG